MKSFHKKLHPNSRFTLLIILFFLFNQNSYAEKSSETEKEIFTTNNWALSLREYKTENKLESSQFVIKYRDPKQKKEIFYYTDVDLWHFYINEETHVKKLKEKKISAELSPKIREELFKASLDATIKDKAKTKAALLKIDNKNERTLWLLKNYL